MNIAVFLFEIPIMCLICLSPPNQVLQRQFILILFVVCKNLGRAWSKSHKINHPQLIQLVMLGVAHSGARAGARGGTGHQPISTVLNVAMNHVTCAVSRVTDHGQIRFLLFTRSSEMQIFGITRLFAVHPHCNLLMLLFCKLYVKYIGERR